MNLRATLVAILIYPLAASAQTIDVSQPNITGSATPFTLGSPFGQSFIPMSSELLLGVYLAVVNDTEAADLLISLYHCDLSGAVLIGSPITTGTISAAEIHDLFEPGATPLYLPIYFDTPYAETPGEHLAFTVAGSSLSFYFASGSSYSGGRLLSDATKDLTFGTIIVPEPTTLGLIVCASFFTVFRQRSTYLRK